MLIDLISDTSPIAIKPHFWCGTGRLWLAKASCERLSLDLHWQQSMADAAKRFQLIINNNILVWPTPPRGFNLAQTKTNPAPASLFLSASHLSFFLFFRCPFSDASAGGSIDRYWNSEVPWLAFVRLLMWLRCLCDDQGVARMPLHFGDAKLQESS